MTELRLTHDGELEGGELVSAYLDGELTAEERVAVERVLRERAVVRAELERMERVKRGLAEMVDSPPPLHLLPRLEARVSRGRALSFWVRWGAVLLAPVDPGLVRCVRETGAVRAFPGATHGRISLIAGALAGIPAAIAAFGAHGGAGAAAALGAAGVFVATLPLLWLASLRCELRWRPRTLALAAALGAAIPLGVELAGAAAAPLAAPAVLVSIATLQWGASARSARRAGGAAATWAAFAAAAFVLSRPDLAGAMAALSPASGLAGGLLAMLDRERRQLAEPSDVPAGSGPDPQQA